MTDSGTGIDSDILPWLFFKVCLKILSRCWIGVFISKNIIEPHDGNIWVKNIEDEGDKGATFAFIIPLIEHKIADDNLGMQINQQQTWLIIESNYRISGIIIKDSLSKKKYEKYLILLLRRTHMSS